MRNFFCCLILTFGLVNFVDAQSIQGVVRDSLGVVPAANILLKDSATPDVIFKYTSTDEKGAYSFQLKNHKDSLLLEVVSMGHASAQKTIVLKPDEKVKTVNFYLHSANNKLHEVLIESKKKEKIKVRHDTLIYNPKDFMDGSERTVEDLLKKLPGIQVKDDGTVFYKGKRIKKLMLDGDDLFEENYKIGTRNIDVDLVDQVEAIDHFHANPLLRDLEDSQDVAINLKIKKGKTNFSGKANLSYALKDGYDESLTGIMLSQKLKFFTTLAYNNIGQNKSPYDFQTSQNTFGNPENQSDLLAPEILSNGDFSSRFPDEYHKMNHSLYANLYTLYHFSKSTKAKIGADFYDDRLTRHNVNQTIYDFGENSTQENFEVLRLEDLTKKPRFYNTNAKVDGMIGDSLAWDYIGKLKYLEIDFNSHIDNNGIIQDNQASTINLFTRHAFHITKRIDKKSALNIKALYSYSRSPQATLFEPPIAYENNQNFPRQKSRFEKQVGIFDAHYYRKEGDLKLKIDGGYRHFDNDLQSQLYTEKEALDAPDSLSNNLNYKYSFAYINVQASQEWKRFKAKAKLRTRSYDLSLNNKLSNLSTSTHHKFLFQPYAELDYRLTGVSKFGINYELTHKAPQTEKLYASRILTSYRTLYMNEPALAFQYRHYFSFGYYFFNTYSVTRFSLTAHTSIQDHNYLTKTIVTPSLNTFSNFLSDFAKKNYGIDGHAEQYVGFIDARVSLSATYSYGKDKNIVNNSGLRDIVIQNISIDNEITKQLSENLYLKNNFFYFYSDYAAEGISNSFASLSNKLNLSYNLNDQLNINLNANYSLPNTKKKENYFFLDFEIYYELSKNLDLTFKAHNLLNHKTYQTIFISDYYQSVSSYNLIQRYILAGVSFSF